MLLHMMELRGRFNAKMIKKAKFGDVHFDETGNFLSVEQDKITGGVSLISFEHGCLALQCSHSGRLGCHEEGTYI